jgi:putative ABC transport system permease protein
MLRNYIKIAWRNLRKNKTYSVINIGGLAVALAVLLIVMLYVRHELSYDEFFTNSDRIYRVLMKDQSGSVSQIQTPVPIPYELKAMYPEVERSVKVSLGNDNELLIDTGQKQIYEDQIISATEYFFNLFDYEFIYGDREASLTKPDGVVLTRNFAEKLFGDKNPVGQTLSFSTGSSSGTQRIVTAVIEDPPTYTHLQFSMILTRERWDRSTWQFPNGVTYLQLKSPKSAESLREKLPGYMENHAVYPEDTEMGGRSLVLQPVTDAHLYPLGNEQPSTKMVYIRIFLAVACLILLIASVNYVNLATARSLERAGEIGVRKTVGATRWQLIRQILTETILTCALAFVLSLLLVELALPFVDQIFGVSLSTLSWITPQWIAIMVGLLLAIALLSGGYCAYIISKFNPAGVLRGAGFGGVNRSSKLQKALMVGQFAISLILIMVTSLMYQQMQYVQSSRLDGVDSQIVVIETQQNKRIHSQFNAFREELLNQPAITQAAAGEPLGAYSLRMTFDDTARKSTALDLVYGTFGYLETLDRKIVSGRSLDFSRSKDSTSNFVINQTAAKYYGFEEANGQHITQPVKGNVVGIFEDYNIYSLYEPIKPTIVGVKYRVDILSNIFVRLEKGQISAGLNQVQNTWNSFDTGIPLDYYFLDQKLDNKYRAELKALRIFGGFSAFSIFIACLGLFGLAAYTARRRTKEIGIRKVMGATVTNVVALLSKDFLKLVALGFVVAVPIAWYAMDWWLQDFAYKIEIGVGVFAAAGGAALLIALATVSWQSVRAAVANPVDSLRSE